MGRTLNCFGVLPITVLFDLVKWMLKFVAVIGKFSNT